MSYQAKVKEHNLKMEDVERYEAFLQNLHALTRKPSRVSLSKLYAKYKACNNSGKALRQMGIIQRIGWGRYYWVSPKLPNREMVVEMLLSNRDYVETTLKQQRTGRRGVPPLIRTKLEQHIKEIKYERDQVRASMDILDTRIKVIEDLLK